MLREEAQGESEDAAVGNDDSVTMCLIISV